MKFKTEEYSKALIQVLEHTAAQNDDKVINEFINLLDKNGDIKNINKIVEGIKRALVKKQGGRCINIEFARSPNEDDVNKCERNFSKADDLRVSVNPELIGGVRITIDGEYELDLSAHRKIAEIFK